MTDTATATITAHIASDESDTRPLTDVCFENFALHPALLKGLEEAGFVRCTPIQALTLPITLAGGDVAGQAQTGTGKTLAFLVALFNRLLTQPARADRRISDPRAVILAPTRELAIQIEKDARGLGAHLGIKLALIYGGVDYDKQRELLRAGCDVIIATPGRMLDYFKQHVFSFNAVEFVVLDEADRMFDLGFIKDIRFVLRRMPPREERQACLFSATLSHRVLELAYEHMNEPQKITVETESITADRVRQQVFFPATEEKIPLLIGLLSRMDCSRTMVFVNTRAWVERVTRTLERAHFRVGALSGDVPQPKREKLLGKFTRGELEILVATDVAARGLHIPGVSHVFNFDLPQDAEDYVHRIGRTARLGAEGDAISFACDLYAVSLPDIEKYIGQSLPRAVLDPVLLQPVIRQPLAFVEGPQESAEEAAADAARATRGAPPKPGSRAHGSSSGPRRDGASAHGRGGPRSAGRDGARSSGARSHDGPRSPASSGGRRDERPRHAASGAAGSSAARVEGAAVTPIPRAPHPLVDGAAPVDSTRKPRRRGGRGRNRHEESAPMTGTDVAASAANSATALATEKPAFLARLKLRIKSLVQRLPMPGRRR